MQNLTLDELCGLSRPLPPHDDLTPVDEAYAGHWYIVLHRQVENPRTGALVAQFCTPSADGAGLHYSDRPNPLSGGLSRKVEDARVKARELEDRYGPHGFTVWLMRHELRPQRGWMCGVGS